MEMVSYLLDGELTFHGPTDPQIEKLSKNALILIKHHGSAVVMLDCYNQLEKK